MSEHPPDDLFEDCERGSDAILGTRTFEDVLFTDETATPVNVLTGETPEHSQATVDEVRAFAAEIDSDTPQIALQASVEAQIETASNPYTAAAFFHFKATGIPSGRGASRRRTRNRSVTSSGSDQRRNSTVRSVRTTTSPRRPRSR